VSDSTSAASVVVAAGAFSRGSDFRIVTVAPPDFSHAFDPAGTALELTLDASALANSDSDLRIRGTFSSDSDPVTRGVLMIYAGIPVRVQHAAGAGSSLSYEVTIRRSDIAALAELAGQVGAADRGRQAGVLVLGTIVLGVYAVQSVRNRATPRVELKRYYPERSASGVIGFQGQGGYNSGEYGKPWNDGKRRCLVLHGIRNNLANMHGLADHLAQVRANGRALYAEVWGAEYEWCAGIRENAALLSRALSDRRIGDNAPKLDIYGHSMGGLVARWCVEKEGQAINTSRVFLLGTPSFGVPVNQRIADLFFTVVGCSDQGPVDLIRVTGENNFQQTLNDGSLASYRDRMLYFTVAGTNPVYFTPAGKLVSFVYTGADNEHDGIVPVISAHYEAIGKLSRAWAERHDKDSDNPDSSYSITINRNHSDLRSADETLRAIDTWVARTQDAVEAWEGTAEGDLGLVIK
jgi:pimeloyl-ACP methyl ester carboxylesterase